MDFIVRKGLKNGQPLTAPKQQAPTLAQWPETTVYEICGE